MCSFITKFIVHPTRLLGVSLLYSASWETVDAQVTLHEKFSTRRSFVYANIICYSKMCVLDLYAVVWHCDVTVCARKLYEDKLQRNV